MFLADGHCDTITELMNKHQPLFENNGHISIKKLKQFEHVLQFFAICLDDLLVDAGALKHTLNAIEFFTEQLTLNHAHIALVKRHADLASNISRQKISALIALEGGEALEGRIENLAKLYALGVRSITLTWNRANALGEPSCLDNATGLTAFGKQVVREMNRLGMVIDVSHCSVSGFWDAIETTTKPLIASHSNCQALCHHHRNLTDSQIKAIWRNNGLIGVNFYPLFLSDSGKASMADVLRHIDHLLHVADENTIGLGSDFDGIAFTPTDMQDATCHHALYAKLNGLYGATVANKIMGGNYMRILRQVL